MIDLYHDSWTMSLAGVDVQDHVEVVSVALPQPVNHPLQRVDGRVLELVGVQPRTVQVLPQEVTPGVAKVHPVWVHHRDHLTYGGNGHS